MGIYDRAFSTNKKQYLVTHLYLWPERAEMGDSFTPEEIASLDSMLRDGVYKKCTRSDMDQYVFPATPENLAVLAVMGIQVMLGTTRELKTDWEVSDGDT